MKNINLKLGLILIMFFSCQFIYGKINYTEKHEAFNFTLEDLNGKEISLNEYRGKVVLINFWASWCAPCLREMPVLEKIYQNYKDQDVQVFGIAIVSRVDEIPKKVNTTGITYPILLGDKQIIADYGYFTSIPQTFIIGRDGIIVKEMEGSYDYSDFDKEIKSALSN